MNSTDKQIIAGLMDLITREADVEFIAEVLDDVYYILAQGIAADPDRALGGKIEMDKNMYYQHMLRDIFARKHETVV